MGNYSGVESWPHIKDCILLKRHWTREKMNFTFLLRRDGGINRRSDIQPKFEKLFKSMGFFKVLDIYGKVDHSRPFISELNRMSGLFCTSQGAEVTASK